jgi:hypothetical protein
LLNIDAAGYAVLKIANADTGTFHRPELVEFFDKLAATGKTSRPGYLL